MAPYQAHCVSFGETSRVSYFLSLSAEPAIITASASLELSGVVFLYKYSTDFILRGEDKYGGNKRPVAGLFQASSGDKYGVFHILFATSLLH